MKAWHFLASDSCVAHGGPLVMAGDTCSATGPLVLCRNGTHASVKPLDALQYAPGPIICRVRMDGEIINGEDKLVARERTVLWMYDASDVLRRFARLCALDVIHLWDAPEIVIRYLKTGDESIRDAAWAAAPHRSGLLPAQAGGSSRGRRLSDRAAWAAAWDAARKNQNKRLHRMLMEGRP